MPRPLPEIIADPTFRGFTAQEKARVLTALDPLFKEIESGQQYQAVKAAEEGGWQAYHPYRMQGYEKIAPYARDPSKTPKELQGYGERHPILEAGLQIKEKMFEPIPKMAIGAPTISEVGAEVLPKPGQPLTATGTVKQAIGVTGRVGAGVGDFMSSPAGLALLAAGVFGGPVVAAALGVGFAATLGADAIEAGKEFYQHPSPENAERFFISLGFAGLPWAHGAIKLKETTAKLKELKGKKVVEKASEAPAAEVAPEPVITPGPQLALPAAPTTVGPEVFEPAYQTGRESRIGPAWQRPVGPYIAPSARPERFDVTGRRPETPGRPLPPPGPPRQAAKPVQAARPAPLAPPAAPIYGAAKGKLAERIRYLEAEVKAIAPEKVTEARKLARGDASAYADLLDLDLKILERAKEKPVRPFEISPEKAGGQPPAALPTVSVKGRPATPTPKPAVQPEPIVAQETPIPAQPEPGVQLLRTGDLPKYAQQAAQAGATNRKWEVSEGYETAYPYDNAVWELKSLPVLELWREHKNALPPEGEGGFGIGRAETKGRIVVDDRMILLDGWHRLKEAAERGQETIEAFVLRPETLPVKPPVKEVAVALAVPLAGPSGRQTVIETSGSKPSATYRIVEAESLETSHHPFTFGKSSLYPEGVQERQYHTNKNAQMDVIRMSQELKPELIVNTDPTAGTGPPQVTPEGVVLGGNARTMALKRAYGEKAGEDYRRYLQDHAQEFGIDPNQIAAMKEPVLVRQLTDRPASNEMMASLGRDLNRSLTKALSEVETAVSAGKRISLDSAQRVADELNRGGETATLREAFESNPQLFRDILLKDGIVAENELPRYFTQQGAINQAGKDFIENALLGRIVPDADLLQSLPKSIANKLERSIPALIEISGRQDAWNIMPDILEAARVAARAQARGWSLEKYFSQGQMFESLNPHVQQIAALFTRPPTVISDVFRKYSSEARSASGPQLFERAFDPVESLDRIIEVSEAKGRIKQAFTEMATGQQLGMGLDPTVLRDIVKVGVYHFERGAKEFNAWSGRMVEEFGEYIRPYLASIYKEASALAQERAANPRKIAEEWSAAILADTKAIRETGTISEALKPGAREEARRITGGGDPVGFTRTIDSAKRNVDGMAKELEKMRARAVEEGTGSATYIKALQVTKEQAILVAQELLEVRRSWGLGGLEFQKPLSPETIAQFKGFIPQELLDRIERLAETGKKVVKPGYADWVYEVWINGLLSGKANIKNFVSNTYLKLAAPGKKAIAGGVSFAQSKLHGTPQERFAGEAWEDVAATYSSLTSSKPYVEAYGAFKREGPSAGRTKLDVHRIKAIPGLAGKIIRSPSNFLLAADEFFYQLNMAAETASLAYREAAKQGKVGPARAVRAGEIVQAPPETLTKEAQFNTTYNLLQDPLGPFGQWLMKGRAVPYFGEPFRYVVPFIRISINSAKMALRESPANIIRVAGKAIKGDPYRGGLFADEVAKIIWGSAIAATAVKLVADGYLTGNGPRDFETKKVMMEDGNWAPTSAKIGNRWVSYNFMEPVSSSIGMAADLVENWDQFGEDERDVIAERIVGMIAKNLTNKTFTTGMTKALLGIMEPDEYMEDWMKSFAGSWIPSGVGAIAQATDPYFRRPRTTVEYLKSKIPGLSKGVEPSYTVFGEPARRGGSALERLASPAYVTEIKDNPVSKELFRLGMRIGEPSRKITIAGEPIDLTGAEYAILVGGSGKGTRQSLQELFDTWDYKKLPKEDQAEMVRRVFAAHRGIQRNAIIRPGVMKRLGTSPLPSPSAPVGR